MTFVGDGRRGLQGGSFSTAARTAHSVAAKLELPAETVTIAGIFETGRLRDGALWQVALGRVSPSQHGFDESEWGDRQRRTGQRRRAKSKAGAHLMTAKASTSWNDKRSAGKPFYLQLSHLSESAGTRRQRASAEVCG